AGAPFHRASTGEECPQSGGAYHLRERPATGSRQAPAIPFQSVIKRPAIAALALVICVHCCGQQSDPTIKVDLKLVNVFVTVTDDHGAPIASLTKEDF